MPLNLPTGERCFIDANIFVYHLVDTPPFTPEVNAFMARIAAKELFAFTSSLVVAEALHRIMLAEVMDIFRPAIKPLAYVQRHPAIISQLPLFAVASDRLACAGIPLLPVGVDCFQAAAKIASAHGLLTNDACIAALMAMHNIRNLATNDDDFKNVPGITTWRPR